MPQLQLSRPGLDEAAPHYHGFIAAVPDEHIGSRLAAQIEELAAVLAPLDDSTALARYAEDKWSIKEVVGHLSDVERIYAYRLLRISRGDATPLSAFDENAYVPAGRFNARPLADLQAEFRVVRLSTLALVDGIPQECWTCRGQASGHGISARAIPYIAIAHVSHHLRILQTRYALGADVASASA